MRRLEMAARSAVAADFKEVAEGAEVIRAFRETRRFESRLADKIDSNTLASFCEETGLCWLALNLDVIGTVCVYLVLVLSLTTSTSGASTALLLHASLLIPIYLSWIVKFTIELEGLMSSVERVLEFSANKGRPFCTCDDAKKVILVLRYMSTTK